MSELAHREKPVRAGLNLLGAGVGERCLRREQVENAPHPRLVTSQRHLLGLLGARVEVPRGLDLLSGGLQRVIAGPDLQDDLIRQRLYLGERNLLVLPGFQDVVTVLPTREERDAQQERARISVGVGDRRRVVVVEAVDRSQGEERRQALRPHGLDVAPGLHRRQTGGGQVRTLRLRPLDQLVHRFRDGVQVQIRRELSRLDREVRRHAHGRRERSSQRLDLTLDRLQDELGLRIGRLRLKHVGDRGHSGAVPLVRGGQAFARRLQARFGRRLERLGVQVLVIGLGHLQSDVLNRGVVLVVGGEERALGLLDVRRPAPEVQEHPGQARRGAVARLKEDRTTAERGLLLAGQVAVELDRRKVLRALGAHVGRRRLGLKPRGACDRIVAQADVEDLGERKRCAGLEVFRRNVGRGPRGRRRRPRLGRRLPGGPRSRRGRVVDRTRGGKRRAGGGEQQGRGGRQAGQEGDPVLAVLRHALRLVIPPVKMPTISATRSSKESPSLRKQFAARIMPRKSSEAIRASTPRNSRLSMPSRITFWMRAMIFSRRSLSSPSRIAKRRSSFWRRLKK